MKEASWKAKVCGRLSTAFEVSEAKNKKFTEMAKSQLERQDPQ